tara:strand:- start:1391 stop:1615 length:225 start_codon:yes stop_codon:yes gene_type:complete
MPKYGAKDATGYSMKKRNDTSDIGGDALGQGTSTPRNPHGINKALAGKPESILKSGYSAMGKMKDTGSDGMDPA